MKSITRTLLMMIACLVVAGSTAHAGDPCHQPSCHYKTVTRYVTKQVPYYKSILKHDHCGNPYYAKVKCWKTIKVAEQYRVKVCH